jgi:hypothetical protein
MIRYSLNTVCRYNIKLKFTTILFPYKLVLQGFRTFRLSPLPSSGKSTKKYSVSTGDLDMIVKSVLNQFSFSWPLLFSKADASKKWRSLVRILHDRHRNAFVEIQWGFENTYRPLSAQISAPPKKVYI